VTWRNLWWPNLQPHDILDQAETLAFPDSVVNYLRGDIGIPPGGFPEPLRSKVLKGRGLDPVDGRPGAFLKDYDFDKERESLKGSYGRNRISEKDLLSYALYPNVFKDWKEYESVYGDVDVLPTHMFLNPMKPGQEVTLNLGDGRSSVIKLVSIQDVDESGSREVLFEVNGESNYISVTDTSVAADGAVREKAGAPGTVGSPMPGVVVGVLVKPGDEISKGETVATLSAMKMETSVPATSSGVVKRVLVNVGDKVDGDDLLVEIE